MIRKLRVLGRDVQRAGLKCPGTTARSQSRTRSHVTRSTGRRKSYPAGARIAARRMVLSWRWDPTLSHREVLFHVLLHRPTSRVQYHTRRTPARIALLGDDISRLSNAYPNGISNFLRCSKNRRLSPRQATYIALPC